MRFLLNELLQRPIGEIGAAKRAFHCTADLSVHGAIATLRGEHIGSLVVVEEMRVLGIFTERDFLEKVALQNVVLTTAKVGEYMTKDPVCAKRSDNLGDVLQKMRAGRFRHMIIVDSYGNLEKVISQREIMDYLLGCLTQAA